MTQHGKQLVELALESTEKASSSSRRSRGAAGRRRPAGGGCHLPTHALHRQTPPLRANPYLHIAALLRRTSTPRCCVECAGHAGPALFHLVYRAEGPAGSNAGRGKSKRAAPARRHRHTAQPPSLPPPCRRPARPDRSLPATPLTACPQEAAAPSPDRLLTDRTSYIAYLESQLERVSAACLTVSSFDGRLEEAVSAVRLLEDKTLNLARLISTAQQFAEQQGESVGEVCRRLRAVEARLAELEQPGRAAEWEDKLRAGESQVDIMLCPCCMHCLKGRAPASKPFSPAACVWSGCECISPHPSSLLARSVCPGGQPGGAAGGHGGAAAEGCGGGAAGGAGGGVPRQPPALGAQAGRGSR